MNSVNSLHLHLKQSQSQNQNQNKIEQQRTGVSGVNTIKSLKPDTVQTSSFHDILGSQLESTTSVQFSKHATIRLNDRNINLTNDQIERVAGGIGQANEKGIRDSLVLVDDVALVVNVKSRTVITALNQVTNNVFSNIDGAVVV